MEPRFGLRRAVDARRGRDGGPHLAAPGPAYDYDAVSRTIGGAVSDSAFHAFESKTWWAHPIGRSAPRTKAFHSLMYDAVDNVFVFVMDGESRRHAYAYRHRN